MEDKFERSRRQVGSTSKYLIKFTGNFKNGMVWNNANEPYLDLKEGIFHIIGGTKSSTHLIKEGGTMWDKVSVPKNKMKVMRLIKWKSVIIGE